MRNNYLKATVIGLGLLALSGLASAGVISSTPVGTVTTSGFGPVGTFNSAAADTFWTSNQALMVSPSNGWLGALSLAGGGHVTYTYLGKEAGFSNHFFNPSGTVNPIDDTSVFGTTSLQYYGNAAPQLLQFSFTSTGNGGVANGGSTTILPQFAIFAGSCSSCGTGGAAVNSGYQFILGYNDLGHDHDFDDLLIGVRTSTGPGAGGIDPLPVPEPATLTLLGLGLAGLGAIRRKKTA